MGCSLQSDDQDKMVSVPKKFRQQDFETKLDDSQLDFSIYHLPVDKWNYPTWFTFKDNLLSNNYTGSNGCEGSSMCKTPLGTSSAPSYANMFVFE